MFQRVAPNILQHEYFAFEEKCAIHAREKSMLYSNHMVRGKSVQSHGQRQNCTVTWSVAKVYSHIVAKVYSHIVAKVYSHMFRGKSV